MAQLNFFGTWNDSSEFMERLFSSLDVIVIPDQWYEGPSCQEYTELARPLEEILRERRKFFVLRKGVRLQASGFRQQQTGQCAGMFRIDIAVLGPGVECTLPADFVKDGTRWLNTASLSYRQDYYDERTQSWHKPSDEVKLLFKQVGQCIKQGCIRRKMIKTSQWCGRDAARLLDAGEAQIAARGV